MARNDDELFWSAMDTLGAKQQRSKSPSKTKRPALATPVVSDDGIDFDALMRESAGPAKMVTASKQPPKPAESALEAEDQSAPEPTKRSSQPLPAPRAAAARYAAQVSEDDLALFKQVVGASQPHRKESAAAPRREPKEVPLKDALRNRDIELDATLDLHGRTRTEALDRTRAFLEESASEGWSYVGIVGGKGVHSPKGQAVLKPFIEGLLRDDFRHFVREYAEAPPYLGGSGTWVVRVNTARSR